MGTQDSIDKVALSLVGLRCHKEMKAFEKEYGSVKVEELLEKEPLEGIKYNRIEAKVHACAPMLFGLRLC